MQRYLVSTPWPRQNLAGPTLTLVFCWSHVRRGFYDLAKTVTAPTAFQALARIAALYEIEAQARGKPAPERLAMRQAESAALMAELHV